MKLILFELVCRVLYIILVGLAIECCFYLSLGFQYEYACIFCQCHNQSTDFCFQSFFEPYDNPYCHSASSPATEIETAIYKSCSDLWASKNEISTNLCHQSKSWGSLGLSCASYMHADVNDPAILLYFYKIRIMLLVGGLQCYAFALPGLATRSRQKWLGIAHTSIFLLALCSILIAPLQAIMFEFQIEPVDSELMPGGTHSLKTRPASF